VPRINVVVAATRTDLDAEGIATAVAAHADMHLVEGRYLPVAEAMALLPALPSSEPCALVLYGPAEETAKHGEDALASRADLAVLRVNDAGDVRIGATMRRMGHPELLAELRSLVERVGLSPPDRAHLVQLRPVPPPLAAPAALAPRDRPLLGAAMAWIHEVLRHAVESLPEARGDLQWYMVNRATVLHELETRTHRAGAAVPPRIADAEAALSRALSVAEPRAEPLAKASRTLGLTFLELRIVLLALAPELDPVYQRCMGLLLDDMGRRVGTLGLHASLLGQPADIRMQLAQSGGLGRWRLIDGYAGSLPPADEPLRLDPPFAGWLLGKRGALSRDARVRRVARIVPWPGAALLDRREERVAASRLADRLRSEGEPQWIVLGNGDTAAWRALIELGALTLRTRPLRIEASRLGGLEPGEIEETAVRIGRLARLTGDAPVVDAGSDNEAQHDDDALRLFLAVARNTGCGGAVITHDEARIVRLLGPGAHEALEHGAMDRAARVAAVRAAAKGAGVSLDDETSEALANRFPMRVDGLEQAMRLARSRPLPANDPELRYERFLDAVREVAAEGVSRLAERIEPVFSLDDVVLPPDRKGQLREIVDNVRLAPHVLDTWKFGEQLPYGRGVTALFHGPSGTGKTMAALGVARELGVQLLRIDLSRVVSKYIGDTEKNIDRAFGDAERSGSAILIDEADALFGKRSEVKDAHDRYANIEVAYLLQRMEAYEGLAILTTNLRQNLDPAFLRRLRFIVEFPRPDADAREKIWRQCLPKESHELDEAAFRQLARRIDLTGGHIRQMTLRAAFIAAAAGRPIGLEHIAHAARAEYAKLGMAPVAIDLPERKKAA
jgi:AAA+ superfamily predicted ATPase